MLKTLNGDAETNDQGDEGATEAVAESRPATLDDLARLLRAIRASIEAGHAELLDAGAASALIGVSRATWDRMRSAGKVPKPVKINGGTIIRWRRAELARWIEDGCPDCR